ncbi:transcriptional regulator PpsR [Leptothrix discophora]|uniref:Transcriptional regulator PpsR n=1 Tax=Leptothrix discophora TaxID=89 RepID=A0ABT9G4G1_LEPDI|nr:transcriptional regulator PpsR [Leptothrix discophora]MDP4301379.1 transcriptional regulator PpsR [Leptothrix discophora]
MHNVGTSIEQWSENPRLYFADLEAEVTAAVIAASADLALVLDGQGVIRDLSIRGPQQTELSDVRQWVGRRWVETVSVESRGKISSMLETAAREAASGGPETGAARPERQVNHPLSGGQELPVSYSVVPLGSQGRVLALGRNLGALAAVQQRLVDAQQSMERDYLRLRHTEARYRLLFEAVDEALLVVDANTFNVFEHNAAAARLLGENSRRIIGRPVIDFLAVPSQAGAQALLALGRNAGRGESDELRLAGNAAPMRMVVSLFRQENASLLLLRLIDLTGPAATAEDRPVSEAESLSLTQVVNAMPDAFVLTDMHGRVLAANPAFTNMLQLPPGDAVIGQPLDRWLGRSSVDLNVLISNLRQHGTLRLFPTTLRSAYGEPGQIEISAVAVADAQPPCLGFSIRDVSRRLPADGRSNRQLPRSADQLTNLVGRMPLKDIVGETAELIERLCIEAALELTRDNRASAAEMLGLSRQSLYVKLRRYGIQDMGQGAGSESDA